MMVMTYAVGGECSDDGVDRRNGEYNGDNHGVGGRGRKRVRNRKGRMRKEKEGGRNKGDKEGNKRGGGEGGTRR